MCAISTEATPAHPSCDNPGVGSDLTTEACRLEVQLLDPDVRSQPSQVAELLHEDFIEYGSSGRRWTRDDIVSALGSEADASRIAVFDLAGSERSDDIVLVTHRSSRDRHEAWRKLDLDPPRRSVPSAIPSGDANPTDRHRLNRKNARRSRTLRPHSRS